MSNWLFIDSLLTLYMSLNNRLCLSCLSKFNELFFFHYKSIHSVNSMFASFNLSMNLFQDRPFTKSLADFEGRYLLLAQYCSLFFFLCLALILDSSKINITDSIVFRLLSVEHSIHFTSSLVT